MTHIVGVCVRGSPGLVVPVAHARLWTLRLCTPNRPHGERTIRIAGRSGLEPIWSYG